MNHIEYNETRGVLDWFTTLCAILTGFPKYGTFSRTYDQMLSDFTYSTNYKLCIHCFSTKQAALRNKSKDWLSWNQNNVSK